MPAAAIAAAAAAAKKINEQLEAKKAAGLINPAQAKPVSGIFQIRPV